MDPSFKKFLFLALFFIDGKVMNRAGNGIAGLTVMEEAKTLFFIYIRTFPQHKYISISIP
jgi:hypothetical protein